MGLSLEWNWRGIGRPREQAPLVLMLGCERETNCECRGDHSRHRRVLDGESGLAWLVGCDLELAIGSRERM